MANDHRALKAARARCLRGLGWIYAGARRRSGAHRRNQAGCGPLLEALESRVLLSGTGLHALAPFTGTNGTNPYGGLVMDSDGNMYGDTEYGTGSPGMGTLFEVAAGGSTITTLATFNGLNGETPGELTIDAGGNLYGTTGAGGSGYVSGSSSGYGVIFELPSGSSTITALVSFTQAQQSDEVYGLTVDTHGNLFGVTAKGGTDSDGTVFEVASGTGAITTLASFDGTNGQGPDGSLYVNSQGDVFGIAAQGGADGDGAVFEVASGSGAITALASFNGTGQGALPGAVTADAQGNLYGRTGYGGAYNLGTVFELPAGGTGVTTLASLGSNEGGGGGPLLLAANGDLFGTGAGSVGTSDANGSAFEVAPGSGAVTLLALFSGTDGSQPGGPIVSDGQGDLFGTANAGGANSDGTVFELSPAGPAAALGVVQQPAAGTGTVTVLATFNGTDGMLPVGNLVLAGGNLYGNTTMGGANSDGTIFEVASGTNAITALASFTNATGSAAYGTVLRDSQGDLFGTAYAGGADGEGTVYELPGDGSTITALASFDGANGAKPFGDLVMDAHGNLYGTTVEGGAHNAGTVFELAGGSSALTTLLSLGGSDGLLNPYAGLVLDRAGDLYGSTAQGSFNGLVGAVFELSPIGTQLAFSQGPFNGAPGQTMTPGVVVDVEDANGDIVTTDDSSVTLGIASGPSGAALSGTLTEAVVDGVATFSNLALPVAGTYTLEATDAESGVAGVASGGFTISGAIAAVTGNSNAIADGATTPQTTNDTSFGSVAQGAPVVDETYTITNTGNATLTVGTPTLPAGFTLVSAPGGTVAAGESTTFTVGLTTASIGTFSGTVSIPTSDTLNNPYTFAIAGTVTSDLPIIDSLTTSGPVIKGSKLTLTASGVAAVAPATVKGVAFYSGTSSTFSTSTTKRLGTGKLVDGNYVLGVATTLLPLGTANFFAIVTDSAKHASAPVSATATILDAPPSIARLTTTNKVVAAGNTVTLAASGVTDKYNTVTSVSFYWAPAPGPTPAPGPGSDTGTVTGAVFLGTATAKTGWKLTASLAATNANNAFNPPPGTDATFLAQAVDQSGTPGNVVSLTIPVVAQAVIGNLGVSPAPIVPTAGVSFTASAVTDADSTVSSVQFWLAPGGSTDLSTIADTLLGTATKASGGDWVLKLKNLKKVEAGSYVVFARALDKNGIWSEAVAETVTVE